MPPAEAQRAIERFRRLLMQGDASAANALINAYGPIWQSLEAELISILELAERRQLSVGQIRRLTRFRALQAQVQAQIERYNIFAEQRIIEAQRNAVGIALDSTQSVVGAALPRGISLDLLASVNVGWTSLPADAFEVFIGISGDGAPLGNLLAELGADAQQGIRQGIAEGILRGRNPRETARIIRNKFGMSLTRSLAISRTESLRAFREATRAQYGANPNIVKGYRRHSAQDDRVCMACIALDGTFYERNVPMDTHVNDRCALVPEVVSYRDLGFNIDDDPLPPTARDWFEGLAPEQQLKMMGPGRFRSWQAGEFQLTEMAKIVENPIWGASAVVKPLKELVGA